MLFLYQYDFAFDLTLPYLLIVYDTKSVSTMIGHEYSFSIALLKQILLSSFGQWIPC